MAQIHSLYIFYYQIAIYKTKILRIAEVHTAVKTKNSRINSVFALIALIELVRQVLWVANGVMRQKNAFLQKLNLEKR